MGDSEKLGGVDNPEYSFNGHYNFLDEFLIKLNLGEKINLVIHDWGCGLGLKFARLHPEIISSITFMEGITVPLKNNGQKLEQRYLNYFDLKSEKS